MRFSSSVLLACTLYTVSQPFFSKNKNKIESPVAKKVTSMTLAEATVAHAYYADKKFYELSIQALERMRALSTSDVDLKKLLLELADTYMQAKKYSEAQKSYAQFISLYPGSAEAKQASHQEIEALHKQLPSLYNDQAITEQLITACTQFFAHYPQDTEFSSEIKRIEQLCYKNLLDHEVYICEQYMHKQVWSYKKTHVKASENRIAYIKEKIVPHYAQAQSILDSLQSKFAQLTNAKKNKWFLF